MTMRKATLAIGIASVFAAADGSGQTLRVDQHGVVVPEDLDRVTLSLSGFSGTAASATVHMVGEHHPSVPTDGPLCRAIRPDSISVPLSAGAGTAEWQFSNRFDGRYRLRCRIRATADGQTADARIQTEPVDWRREIVTLTPSTVSVGVTTFVDVEAYAELDYSSGTVRNAPYVTSPPVLMTGEGCDGVEADSLQLTLMTGGDYSHYGGEWAVVPRSPVSNCVVHVDGENPGPGFHAQATLIATPPAPPTPKPPAVVQTSVNDVVADATSGEGLRTGGASVAVPLDALFSFMPSAASAASAASAVTYAGATFSVSSTSPSVVSVSASMTDAGPAVELTPGEDAGTATVTVDARPEGQPAAPPLASVMFEVEVVAQAPSTDATLSGLVLSDGTQEVALMPAFDSATHSYTATVSNSVTSVTVTPTVTEASATVTVNGTAVASGSPSGAIDLEVGESDITVVVTAEDGTTTLTYTVTVTKMTPVPAMPLGGALLLGILLACLGGRSYWDLWKSQAARLE